MRKNHVVIALLLAFAVCMTSADALAVSFLSRMQGEEDNTVTITKDEYARLLR